MQYHCTNPDCEKNAPVDEEWVPVDLKCKDCGTDLAPVEEGDKPDETSLLDEHSTGEREIEELIDNLPTFLAIPLAEYQRETNPVLALWAASDLMEIALKFCVMAGLAEHEELSAKLQTELRDKQLERPTMGNWMGMAEIVVRHLPADTRLPELASTVKNLSQLLGSSQSSIEDGLLNMRNQFLAHGGPCKRKQAEHLFGIWKPEVNRAVIESFGWLNESQLLAHDASKELFLLRGEEAVLWEETSPLPPDALPGSAWLITTGEPFLLGPLGDFDSEERALRIYVRREEVGLQYLRMDEEGGFHDSGKKEVEWFKNRFRSRLQDESTDEFKIRSFESDIRRESARRVGRETELKTLLDSLYGMENGSLWVGGLAGIGKSNLMSCVMEILLDDPPGDVLVLPYLFRAGDDRCAREAFLRYLRERLKQGEWLMPDEASGEDDEKEQFKKKRASGDPVTEVRQLLLRLREGAKVFLLLDGLDEIVERDSRFVEDVVFGIACDRVALVGAARPEHGIPKSFLKRGALDPFPDGLPPMSENDARAFLIERAGNVRKRLLNLDKERGDKISNHFFTKVAERSGGLPIYLNCLLHDLHQGKISPENTDSLPRGIHAYHEELLQRHSIGDLNAVTTPALVTLALAHEPLTTAELTAFLKRFGKIKTENLELVDQVLQILASMLRRAPDPDGEEGYTLYHHSLREHILESENLKETVPIIRKKLADASLHPVADKAVELYLLRCGIRHLLEDGRRDGAEKLLLDLDHLYMMVKLGAEWLELYEYWMELDDSVYSHPALKHKRIEQRAWKYLQVVEKGLSEEEYSGAGDVLKKCQSVVSLAEGARWDALQSQLLKVISKASEEFDSSSNLHLYQCKLKEADLLYADGDAEEAINVYKSCFPLPEDLDWLKTHIWDSIAKIYLDEENFESASEFIFKSIEVKTKSKESTSGEIAISYTLKARYLIGSETDSLSQAIEDYETAIDLILDHSGPDDSSLTAIYGYCARAYGIDQNYIKMLEYYEKKLVLEEKLYGTQHPLYRGTFADIAFDLNEAGERVLSVRCWRMNLPRAGREKLPEETERDYNLRCLSYGIKAGYARTLEEVGREFKVSRERIKEIEAKALRKMRHPERFRQLHGFFAPEQDAPDSEKHEDEASCNENDSEEQGWKRYKEDFREQLEPLLERLEKKLDPLVADDYLTLGNVCGEAGELDRAIEFYEKILKEIERQSLEPDQFLLARTYRIFGDSYRERGDHDKAIEYYQMCLEIELKSLGPDHPDTKKVEEALQLSQSKLLPQPNSKIRISRGGKTYGPYDRAVIERHLASGKLLPSDWAWTDGMKEWARLEDILREINDRA